MRKGRAKARISHAVSMLRRWAKARRQRGQKLEEEKRRTISLRMKGGRLKPEDEERKSLTVKGRGQKRKCEKRTAEVRG